MKRNFSLTALAAAAVVVSMNANAGPLDITKTVGPLDYGFPIHEVRLLQKNKTYNDTYNFTLVPTGASIVLTGITVFGDSSEVLAEFSGSVKDPSSAVTPLTYSFQDLGGGFGVQELDFQLITAASGLYQLKVKSITGTATNSYTIDISAAPEPEPETLALMLAGLGVVGFVGVRRKAI
jgi:hypothetical protein